MSPVVIRVDGIKFHFFANEGTPREPVHIHASRPGASAKLWLHPEVSIANSHGYNEREKSMIVGLATQHRKELQRAWHEFFGKNRSL